MVHISKDSGFFKLRLILWPIGAIIMMFLLLLGFYYLACLLDPAPQNVDNPNQAYELGLKYKYPDDLIRNYQKSAAYLTRATELGNEAAYAHLAHLIASRKLDMSDKKAIEYAHNALATHQKDVAYFALGLIHANKESLFFNQSLAESYYQKAYDLGLGIAARALRAFYVHGKYNPEKKNIWDQRYKNYLLTKEPDYPFIPEHIINWYLNSRE